MAYAGALPLLTHGPGEPVAFRVAGPVHREEFLEHVEQTVEQLHDRPFVINLCEDRYTFMVSFAAAMIRGQTTLLSPGRAPKLIEDLASDYAGSYCLCDARIGGLNVEQHSVRLADSATRAREPVVPEVSSDQDATIAFTSGSTGRPSPNQKRWGDLVLGAQLAMRRFEYDLRNGGTILATIPPQHMYGLEVSILLPLISGTPVFSGLPFFPEDIRRAMASVPGPRTMFTTPAHLRACVESDLEWPEVEFVVSATAPMSAELARSAEKSFRARVLEIYGCTEAGSMASRRTLDGDMWHFYDGMWAQERNGEFYVTGDHLPEPVALNDYLELHEQPRFKLLGRHSDLVNIAGNRASLSDLNLKLNSIEGVRDGVFVMPERENHDRIWRLVALVVAPDLDKQDVMNALADRIDPVFFPRPLYMVESLPRTVMGKLPRAELEKLLERLQVAR